MTVLDPALARAVAAWSAQDPDPDTRGEVAGLVAQAEAGADGTAEADGAAEALADAFTGRLQFGTAGLRGALGAGPNRMNRVVVGQAAAARLSPAVRRVLAGLPPSHPHVPAPSVAGSKETTS